METEDHTCPFTHTFEFVRAPLSYLSLPSCFFQPLLPVDQARANADWINRDHRIAAAILSTTDESILTAHIHLLDVEAGRAQAVFSSLSGSIAILVLSIRLRSDGSSSTISARMERMWRHG